MNFPRDISISQSISRFPHSSSRFTCQNNLKPKKFAAIEVNRGIKIVMTFLRVFWTNFFAFFDNFILSYSKNHLRKEIMQNIVKYGAIKKYFLKRNKTNLKRWQRRTKWKFFFGGVWGWKLKRKLKEIALGICLKLFLSDLEKNESFWMNSWCCI